MRWIPFIAFFLYIYIEISIFIQVAHVFGVFLTLVLVIFTSVIGMSLVRNQGFKHLMLMQQKMEAGESPAAEMLKSVSLIIAG
ncbi:FxsA family protein, partial [Cronobacter sakazakii]|uniref:FxsA family protein n=1 Tax=Cronobacter sakazakii TaxID=28141 RepID=UPI0015C44529